MRLTTVLLLLMAAAMPMPSVAQDTEKKPAPERTKEQAYHDAKLLSELYDKHNEAFEGIYGGVSVSETSVEATLKLCEEHYAKIQNLEESVLPEIQPELARILELWGKPPDEEEAKSEDFDDLQYALGQGGEIEWNMKMTASGEDVQAARDLPEEFSHVSTRFIDLTRMLGNVEKTRESNAEYLADLVKNVYSPDIIEFYVEDIRVDKLKEAKTLLEWALKFDAGNEFANDRMATIDADIDALAKAIEAAIDARKWAGTCAGRPRVLPQSPELGEEREGHRGAGGLRTWRLGAGRARHLRPHHQLGSAGSRGRQQAGVQGEEPRPCLRVDRYHTAGRSLARPGPALRELLGRR
jgi:hypothetical protein